jgi:glutamate N-acetyltransferase/amino-acid N-acetyltransferase
MIKISPLAPKEFAELPPIKGVLMSTANTGIKYKQRDDLLLVSFPGGAQAAGVFTKSKCSSAPVDWCRAQLKTGKPARGLLVNAGNANAFTGKAGDRAMASTIAAVAGSLCCDQDQIYVASTGVIGVVLPADKINAHIKNISGTLGSDKWQLAADAIRTTDTFPKVSTRTAKIAGENVIINGITKGSGMIAPDMATMLGFIFTDAAIGQQALLEIIAKATEDSFNAITVDSDTSTSDTLMIFATGIENMINDATDPALDDFKSKLFEVCHDLALQIVRDGEGARKLIRINVSGAENGVAARRIAMSIANSPLVKTAIAGEDANWGRIVMAVGKAGEKASRDDLKILIGGQKVTEHGMGVDGYDEQICTAHLKGQEIDIEVDVGIAQGTSTVWTCDLTHEYISINADYRS